MMLKALKYRSLGRFCFVWLLYEYPYNGNMMYKWSQDVNTRHFKKAKDLNPIVLACNTVWLLVALFSATGCCESLVSSTWMFRNVIASHGAVEWTSLINASRPQVNREIKVMISNQIYSVLRWEEMRVAWGGRPCHAITISYTECWIPSFKFCTN